MKRQFIFSFKALIKSSKFFNCIVFAILTAFLLEFIIFKDQTNLYELGTTDYGFFFLAMGEDGVLGMLLMTLPLLAVLPYGDAFFKEREFINQIFTRTSKAKYLFVNTCMAFVVGFLFIFILLLFMYFLNFLILKPSGDNPFYYTVTSVVENNNMPILDYSFFITDLLENPALYNLKHIIILSGYVGLLSMTTYSISLCVKNKIIAYITPFVITTLSLLSPFFIPVDFQRWSAPTLFSPGGASVTYPEWGILFWILLFLIISISFNAYKYRKDVIE